MNRCRRRSPIWDLAERGRAGRGRRRDGPAHSPGGRRRRPMRARCISMYTLPRIVGYPFLETRRAVDVDKILTPREACLIHIHCVSCFGRPFPQNDERTTHTHTHRGDGGGYRCVLSDGGPRSNGSPSWGPTTRIHTHSQSLSLRPPYGYGCVLSVHQPRRACGGGKRGRGNGAAAAP